MSAITSSNVEYLRGWFVGDGSGKHVQVKKHLAITLSSQGGTTGDIPASALGLSRIDEINVQCLDASGTITIPHVGVAKDGSELLPINLNQSTDASRSTRANLTGILYCWVTGIS